MRNGPYILVVAPDDFPGMKYRGRYAYEHTVVWWKNTGTVPGPGLVLHHKNENKHDNRFENLEIQTRGAHTTEHCLLPPVVLKCAFCSDPIKKTGAEVRFRASIGQKDFCCSRSCAGKRRWVRDGGWVKKSRFPRRLNRRVAAR